MLVSNVPGVTPHVIAAAHLHDVVEDTGVTHAEIEQEFGHEISVIVGWLTDVSTPADGNRAARKAVDRAHTSLAPAAAQNVKLADIISNVRSIVAHDPEFAKVYLAEKRLLLDVLTRGDATLMAQARSLVGVEE